ncbi:agmatine deiminase family protein [Amphiplicatus metriothermophilus]|uniref:Agmatine deiminase n=1 Tax=Amphiplicatus metriothermophilus TaxID=1519374 RepID=A0A239PPF9_9PROT|nr:agmatine deiminase family protein [Amphiplicatus metriothermophilus]MBB5518652.1 agmatine deiminase [Amphiplicatus metriothermophilus]SNT72191.1 agmatine deiminase [Amphiplicatus metriothermophilus]
MLSFRRQPAEWSPHAAVWIGWPSAADLWKDDLDPARREVEGLVRAVAFPAGAAGPRGERVELVLRGAEARAAAEAMRARLPEPDMVRPREAPIGDIWLRDTGPVFVKDEAGRLAASAFRFNGWGGKYELAEDDRIADIVAAMANVRLRRFEGLVAEGGAIEVDGEGTVITTRQCLLNPNRNPGAPEGEIEAVLKAAVGAEKTIWLDEGLAGDHTDGHVDNIARFVAPGKVVCMRPTGSDDPNADVLNAIRKTLAAATDAAGRRLEVIEIPSPGRALIDGAPVPASHMNFYIANESLVLPTYGRLTGEEAAAEEAAAILRSLAVRKDVVTVDSSALLTGGGSFHCITQQQPA